MAPKKPDSAPAAKAKTVKGPHVKVEKAWTFKKYQNGMLNLKAPARYLSISKDNSTTSPLLTLPAEIRNKILSYAVGGYDIYIKATNCAVTDIQTTNSIGFTSIRRVCKQIRVKTILLPSGTEIRSAKYGDMLPALALPLICRQLYTETSLLPYMLNHFKLVGGLQRTPAQLKAIASIAPASLYTYLWIHGHRPAFSTLFAALSHLDLRGFYFPNLRKNKVMNKDLASSLDIQWSKEGDFSSNEGSNVDAMRKGLTHFDVIVKVNLD